MAKKLKETYIQTYIQTYRLPLVVLSAAVAAKNLSRLVAGNYQKKNVAFHIKNIHIILKSIPWIKKVIFFNIRIL